MSRVDYCAPTTLYRLFNADGALLYVGISTWPWQRLDQHEREKVWWPEVTDWTMVEFGNRRLARAAEYEAIRTERPIYNAHLNEHNPARRPSLLKPRVQPVVTCPVCGHDVSALGSGLYGPRTLARHHMSTRKDDGTIDYYGPCKGSRRAVTVSA